MGLITLLSFMTTYKEFKKVCSCRVYLNIYFRVLNTTFLKFARRKKVNVCSRDFLLSGETKIKEGKTSKKE